MVIITTLKPLFNHNGSCTPSGIFRTEESFEGWLVRLLRGTMQKMLDTSLQTWLVLLKQKAEEAT